jgi:hypothetical protein
VPAVDAPGRDVIAFYDENAGRETAASVVALVAGVFLVLFAAHVRRIIVAAEGTPATSPQCFSRARSYSPRQ